MIPENGYSRNRQKDAGKVIVSCGNTRESTGTWKQYSHRKIFGFFSTDFRLVPARKYRKIVGIDQKKSENFPMGILLPCSSAFPHVPAGTSPDFFTWE
jgi:hypothetical protein